MPHRDLTFDKQCAIQTQVKEEREKGRFKYNEHCFFTYERKSNVTICCLIIYYLTQQIKLAHLGKVFLMCLCFSQYNIILQNKFLDSRSTLLLRMGFSPHKCTNCLHKLFFCSVSPACKNVCNYSSITHVDTMCTERDFTQQRRYFCGVRGQEGRCLQRCKSVH